MVPIDTKENYIYKLEIYRVFSEDARSYQERRENPNGFTRERLEEPVLIFTDYYFSASAARNYGSNRTGRKAWYNNLNRPRGEYQKFYNEPRRDQWDYEWKFVEFPPRHEPDLDYKVFKVKVDGKLTVVGEIPQLKKLSD